MFEHFVEITKLHNESKSFCFIAGEVLPAILPAFLKTSYTFAYFLHYGMKCNTSSSYDLFPLFNRTLKEELMLKIRLILDRSR